MSWLQAIVRVWHGRPKQGGTFAGTAFFVRHDTLITARHVVSSNADALYITGMPDGSTEKIAAHQIQPLDRDIAILTTSRSFPTIEPLSLLGSPLQPNVAITLVGFFDEEQAVNQVQTCVAGHVGVEDTWRLQGSIANGMSGGPALTATDAGVHVIGVVQAHDRQKNTAYMIPITAIATEEAIRPLIPALQAPVKIFGAPSLPASYLQRDDHFEQIKQRLITGFGQSVGITGVSRSIGVQGMGGIGKSVLAAAIGRDLAIHRAFPDGVFWISLGQNPDLLNAQKTLLGFLGAYDILPNHIRGELENHLANKQCLLIIDDVWDSKHLEQFDVATETLRMLITTRDAHVLRAFGVEEYRIDVLSKQQALALLRAQSNYKQAELPAEAQGIIQECGSLPLALSMIGAMLRDQTSKFRWQRILDLLQAKDLERITFHFKYYPYPNLFKALHVSVVAQPEIVQTCYLELAIFPENTPIPIETLRIYWSTRDFRSSKSVGIGDPIDVIDRLEAASLLFYHDEAKTLLTLHNLQRDYVRQQCPNIHDAHEALINAYTRHYPDGWHTIPLEEPYYIFRYFDYHMHQAGQPASQIKDVALELINRKHDLNWSLITKYSQLLGKSTEDLAYQIIQTNTSGPVLATCLMFLGKRAKPFAPKLLQDPQTSDDVITACLYLLKSEAKHHARQIIQGPHSVNVITACLQILGSEAREEARRFIQQFTAEHCVTTCLQILGPEAKPEARRLLQTPTSENVIAACLNSLGEDAREDALRLLREHNGPNVIVACLKLLGNTPDEQALSDAREHALRLLREHNGPNVIVACLKLLGNTPDEQTQIEVRAHAQRLLQNAPPSQVIVACLKLLGDDARDQAKHLLQTHTKARDVTVACLQLLGKDAQDDARQLLTQRISDQVQATCFRVLAIDNPEFIAQQLRSNDWDSFRDQTKLSILQLAEPSPRKHKRSIEILNGRAKYHPGLVAAALSTFDKDSGQITNYCQNILIDWEQELQSLREKRKGSRLHTDYIIKAMLHPSLYRQARKVAVEMLKAEEESPGLLGDELLTFARSMENGTYTPWPG